MSSPNAATPQPLPSPLTRSSYHSLKSSLDCSDAQFQGSDTHFAEFWPRLENDQWSTPAFSSTNFLLSIGGNHATLSPSDDFQMNGIALNRALVTTIQQWPDQSQNNCLKSQSSFYNTSSEFLDELISEEQTHSSAQSEASSDISHDSHELPPTEIMKCPAKKSTQTERKERRRLQNRASQRRFREGEKARMREAAQRIITLEARLKFQMERNHLLEREWSRMMGELECLARPFSQPNLR